jgi:hypothetical protein
MAEGLFAAMWVKARFVGLFTLRHAGRFGATMKTACNKSIGNSRAGQ